MPNGLNNWTYKDITRFLKESGFVLHHEKAGSHEAWANEKTSAVVEVNFTSGSYPIRTLETMIRQSKIDKKEWRKWSSR
jgi:predicted RNA binding protein YcfA (HicA-like mRNA interferase family)